jgi:hypothetical protein
MPTYVVNIHLKGIAPIARHAALDDLMGSLGFLPFRPGVPPEGPDEYSSFSQWEYAANSPLEADQLTALLQTRIKSEIQNNIEVTVWQVRARAE